MTIFWWLIFWPFLKIQLWHLRRKHARLIQMRADIGASRAAGVPGIVWLQQNTVLEDIDDALKDYDKFVSDCAFWGIK